jgi:Beta-propeller repeat
MPFLTGERMLKVLKTKLNLVQAFIGREFGTYRNFVLIIGLAVFFLFYGEIAHAEAIYSYTKTIGGNDHDFGQSVAVDSSGNVYITGSFRGTVDFDPGAGTDNHTSAGEEDIFLTKFDSNGSYVYTKTMGGTAHDYGRSVAVDSSGNVYITGYFEGTADFDPGVAVDNHLSAGLEDIFLTKIYADGSYGYTKTMGGTNSDYGRSVAVDSSGNIYVTGSFRETVDFNPSGTADSHTSAGLEDIFLTKINPDESYGYTKTMGGTDHDEGESVAVDGGDNVYITGYFSGANVDFNPGAGTDNHTSAGLEDIFLTRINSDESYEYTKTMGGTDHDYGRSVALDSSDNVYITGSFQETVDFDPGTGTDSHTSAGLDDIYLTKFRMVGFIVVPTSVTTTGAGGTATFTVKLLSEPSADVTLPVSSSDSNIGTVDKSSLTFTNADWFVEQTVTITSVTNDGLSILLGAATSADADYNGLDAQDVTVTITGNASGGSGCFIATAAYGSSLAPYVKVLSQFRDRFLLTNGIGRRFVHFYYTHSPPMADFIQKHDNLRAMVRLLLIPLVGAGWLALKIGLVSAMALIFFFGIGLIGLAIHVRFRSGFKISPRSQSLC